MKTLKRTLVALAALTVASMSMTTVAFATEDTTTAAEDTTVAAAEDTTEAAAEAENKGDASAATSITIGTVTVTPGTTSVSVPVTIAGNVGFAGTGLGYSYGSEITYNSTSAGIVEPEEATGTNYVALASAKGKNITDNGVLYTLEFTIPADAKAGDVFPITGSIDGFSDASGANVAVSMIDGAIKVADEEVVTTEAATAGTAATAAAAKAAVGSSPATGEALPIAGAAAAVAVIGGVAIASRKRK